MNGLRPTVIVIIAKCQSRHGSAFPANVQSAEREPRHHVGVGVYHEPIGLPPNHGAHLAGGRRGTNTQIYGGRLVLGRRINVQRWSAAIETRQGQRAVMTETRTVVRMSWGRVGRTRCNDRSDSYEEIVSKFCTCAYIHEMPAG